MQEGGRLTREEEELYLAPVREAEAALQRLGLRGDKLVTVGLPPNPQPEDRVQAAAQACLDTLELATALSVSSGAIEQCEAIRRLVGRLDNTLIGDAIDRRRAALAGEA